MSDYSDNNVVNDKVESDVTEVITATLWESNGEYWFEYSLGGSDVVNVANVPEQYVQMLPMMLKQIGA